MNFFQRQWDSIKHLGWKKHLRYKLSDLVWGASELAYRLGNWLGVKLEDLAHRITHGKEE